MSKPARIGKLDIMNAVQPSLTLFVDARPGRMREYLPRPSFISADGRAFYQRDTRWGRVASGRRPALLARDGNRCVWCQTPGDVCELQIDHIIPVCHGGSDHDDNLQVLCRGCNQFKKGQLSSEFDRNDFVIRFAAHG